VPLENIPLCDRKPKPRNPSAVNSKLTYTVMHRKQLALALQAATYFAVSTTAQFVRGPLEPPSPALPHTAVYTTTLSQDDSTQAKATVIVTVIVPRDVGHPNNGSLATGTAISHFSTAQKSGAASTWSETVELVWRTLTETDKAPDPKDAGPTQGEPARSTLTAVYTDYQHSYVGLYGAWSVVHYDLSSTIRETIVEVVGPEYPRTVVRTGYTDIKVAQTIAVKDGPTTTDPDRDSMTYLRTTTLVQVAASPA